MDTGAAAALAVEPTPRAEPAARLPWRAYVVAALAYAVSAAAAHGAGMRMNVWWALVQLLDPEQLLARPWSSLLYLHSQPPGLNALAAAFVHFASWTASSVEQVGAVGFFAFGLLAAPLVLHLAWRITGSRFWGALACAWTLCDPGFHFYRLLLHYSMPLYCLVLIALAAADRYWTAGSRRALLLAVAAICGLTLTSSLYAPLWSAATCGLILLLRRVSGGAVRGWKPAAALALALLAAWPLKNRWVFGQAADSSWSGYNLTRGTPVVEPDLQAYLDRGVVPDAWIHSPLATRLGAATSLPVLSAPRRSSGVRNWNHYGFLLSNRDLQRRALAWRVEHPRAWARESAVNYLLWGRPTYVDSYWGVARGPDTAAYRAWTRWHQRLLYPDLRFVVERLGGPLARLRITIWGGPAPYPALTVIVLPLLVAASLGRLVVARRSGRFGAADALAAMALWILLWTLIAPCLTDGFEGNRMRFPSGPTLLLLAGYLLRPLTSRISVPYSADRARSSTARSSR